MTRDPGPADDREQRLHVALTACLEAADSGRAADLCAALGRHPEFAGELAEFLGLHARVEEAVAPLRTLTAEDTAEYRGGGEASPEAPPAAGPTPFGDYELHEVLGEGGMGVVHRAWQPSLIRFVALKVIRAGRLASPDDVRRFRGDAQKAAHLTHPHIVPILECGEHERQLYFTMKLMEGGSLSDQIKRGPVASRRAAEWLQAVAQAVEAAHRAGIIHRDLKPANVLLDAQGQAHIADFGLARWIDREASLTATGAIVGTVGYMAPEQVDGRATLASDVYGLGAILYTLLTGRPPFQAETVLDTLQHVLHQEAAPPRLLNPNVPSDLERICLKCLEKDPAQRYSAAAELAEDLADFLAGEPPRHTPPPQWWDFLVRPVRYLLPNEPSRDWGGAYFACAGAVVLAHAVVFALVQADQPVGFVWLTLGLLLALMATIQVVRLRNGAGSPTTVEGQVIVIWIAYTLGMPLLFYPYTGPASAALAAYPALAILTGVLLFICGSMYWGRCYLFGLGFLAAAVLMRLRPEWAPLEMGLWNSFYLLSMGWHLCARRKAAVPGPDARL
jgi:serine/threonine-protein kinase